jgi:PadR family transcriptional regulator, regulatory protein PadR
MESKASPLLRGTLDMMVLKSVAGGPQHGYAITRRLADASDEVILVEEGSLYPALHRLEAKGWLTASWGRSENGRKAKYYRLTESGRRQLAREERSWSVLSRAITKIMSPLPEGR